MKNPKEFLGRGWAFPFRIDAGRGGVALSEYEENIRQNITIILGTRPGERQKLPQFGCRIHELLFAPDTKATSSAIAHHVEEALRRWEKRIEVDKVDAKIESQGAVRVTVDYRVVATGAAQSMGYTVRSR